MTDLKDVARTASDHNLAEVAATRADGSIQASAVNAGIIENPVTDEPVVAFVTYAPTKLAHLQARPCIALTFRARWNWATVEIAGPEDLYDGIAANACGCCCVRSSPPWAAPTTTGDL